MKRQLLHCRILCIILLCCLFAFPASVCAQAPPADLPASDRRVRVQPADTIRAALGEGAIWHAGRKSLFWVDITGCRLYEFLPAQKQCRHWAFPLPVSTVVPETDSTVVVALQNCIERLYLVSDRRDTLAPIPDRNGKLRTNDGKCDPAGRLWVGTMAYDGMPESGSLYSVEADGRVTLQLGSVSISNGLVWTADRTTMYYIDTPTHRVGRYRYDEASGRISFEETAIIVPEEWGSPDGMTIDREGKLWIAHWGGWGVYCWDPDSGELIRRIALPVPHVTSCAFGGASLDTLYITTAGGGRDSEKGEAGKLFFCKPGAQGVEAFHFGRKN